MTNTHPPFEAANEVATKHGANSDRRIQPIAERLRVEMVGEAPWLSRPAFAAALAAWSRAEAKVVLISAWLDDHGVLDEEGNPRPAATYAERLEASAASRRRDLGLDPLAFARLLTTFTGTGGGAEDVVTALQAEGRAILAARAPEALSAPQNGGHPARDGFL